MAQYQGFADVQMGRGAIVIGLAAIIIGEVFRRLIKITTPFDYAISLFFVIVGGIVYYVIMGIAL